MAKKAKRRAKTTVLSARQRKTKRKHLVKAIERTGCVTAACREVEIDRATYYQWRKKYPDFAEQVSEALDLATDQLEIEARRRAVDGVDKPVYQGGEMVGTIREYSDTLMNTLLRGNRPEKYGKAGTNVTVNNNTLNINAEGVIDVSPERQAMLQRLRAMIVGAYPEAEQLAAEHKERERKGLPVIDVEAAPSVEVNDDD